jgi:hypothetical protein
MRAPATQLAVLYALERRMKLAFLKSKGLAPAPGPWDGGGDPAAAGPGPAFFAVSAVAAALAALVAVEAAAVWGRPYACPAAP